MHKNKNLDLCFGSVFRFRPKLERKPKFGFGLVSAVKTCFVLSLILSILIPHFSFQIALSALLAVISAQSPVNQFQRKSAGPYGPTTSDGNTRIIHYIPEIPGNIEVPPQADPHTAPPSYEFPDSSLFDTK